MDFPYWRPPYPDELLYGWILEMKNTIFPYDAYGTQRFVGEAFPFSKTKEQRAKESREALRKEYIRGLDKSIQRFHKLGYSFPDTKELLTYNTPIIATGIARSAGEEARIIHTAVSEVTGGLFDMPKTPLSLKELRVCPYCMYEKPYIRTWHNLPGVKACAIHGTALCVINEQTMQTEPQNSIATEDEILFARYAKTVYDTPSDITLQKIRSYMLRHRLAKVSQLKELLSCSRPYNKIIRMLIEHNVDYTSIVAQGSDWRFQMQRLRECMDRYDRGGHQRI